MAVAQRQRLVEAKLVAQRGKGLRRGRGAEHDRGLVARHEVDHGEEQQRDNHQGREEAGKAPRNECDQAVTPGRRERASNGVPSSPDTLGEEDGNTIGCSSVLIRVLATLALTLPRRHW